MSKCEDGVRAAREYAEALTRANGAIAALRDWEAGYESGQPSDDPEEDVPGEPADHWTPAEWTALRGLLVEASSRAHAERETAAEGLRKALARCMRR